MCVCERERERMCVSKSVWKIVCVCIFGLISKHRDRVIFFVLIGRRYLLWWKYLQICGVDVFVAFGRIFRKLLTQHTDLALRLVWPLTWWFIWLLVWLNWVCMCGQEYSKGRECTSTQVQNYPYTPKTVDVSCLKAQQGGYGGWALQPPSPASGVYVYAGVWLCVDCDLCECALCLHALCIWPQP